MLKKSQTSNPNIKKTEPLFIKCAQGKGIRFIPLYVHHNNSPDELYYKIELHYRDNLGEWHILNKNDAFNITQKNIEKLFEFITVTTELRTKETISVLDLPNEQAKFIGQLLESGGFKDLIDSGKLNEYDFRFLKDTIRISTIEKSINELENLLSTSDTEKDYEDWCAVNSWVFGNYYIETESVHQITNAERVDLLIKNAINKYRDIIEFKKPSFSVLVYDTAHQNYYFSSEVSKAISQVLNYSDIFTYVANNGLHRHQEIMAYYPQSIIVIGRSNKFNEEQIKALHGLNSRLNGIIVKTYDDLLTQARNLLHAITMPINEEKNSEETVKPDVDDLPF